MKTIFTIDLINVTHLGKFIVSHKLTEMHQCQASVKIIASKAYSAVGAA